MARPNKTNLDYFPFDCDFFEDEKIVAIAGEFGIKGEITTVKLLCAIYRNGYYVQWNEMMKMKMLRSLPGVSLELLNQIVGRLVRWEFFDANLFSTAKILTSRAIQERYFAATKRWKKNVSELRYLLVNVTETRVNVTLTPVNVAEMPQNKNKIKYNAPLTPQGGNGGGGDAQSKTDEFDLKIDELRKSEVRLESFQRMYGKSREQILAYLDRYVLWVKATGEKIVSPGAHFNGWLRTEIQRENTNNLTDGQRQKLESDKYGIDSDSKKQKDWDATF